MIDIARIYEIGYTKNGIQMYIIHLANSEEDARKMFLMGCPTCTITYVKLKGSQG